MQTNYRYVPCPGCKREIRLTVRDEKCLGKPVRLTCTICGEDFKTILPVSEIPPNTTPNQPDVDISGCVTEKDLIILEPLAKEFEETLREMVRTSPELDRILGKFRAAGCDPILMIDVTMGFLKQNSARVCEPVPLVKDGNVVPEAFTASDVPWLHDFLISLGPEK